MRDTAVDERSQPAVDSGMTIFGGMHTLIGNQCRKVKFYKPQWYNTGESKYYKISTTLAGMANRNVWREDTRKEG